MVTAFSCMSLNAFICCSVNSVFRPTKLVLGRSVHSSRENRIDGCSTFLHVSSASSLGIHLNCVIFFITVSLNAVKLRATFGESTSLARVHASAGVWDIGVPVSIHSQGWLVFMYFANILYRLDEADLSAVASSYITTSKSPSWSCILLKPSWFIITY